jgi:hypothetical protein
LVDSSVVLVPTDRPLFIIPIQDLQEELLDENSADGINSQDGNKDETSSMMKTKKWKFLCSEVRFSQF